MITLILCLRPLRVPKFIWFKILHDRRYEFGPEMCQGETPFAICIGASAANNLPLVKASWTSNKAVAAAFTSNSMTVIKYFLESRMNRTTLIYHAARTNCTFALDYLRGAPDFDKYFIRGSCRGAQLHALTNTEVLVPEHLTFACKSGNLTTVTHVYKNTIEGDRGGYYSQLTCLNIAFKKNFISIARYLLYVFGDYYAQTSYGRAWMHVGQEIYELLPQNVMNNGDFIDHGMYEATRKGNVELVKYFLQAGASSHSSSFRVAFGSSVEMLKFWMSIMPKEKISKFGYQICQKGDVELLKSVAHLFDLDYLLKIVYYDSTVKKCIIDYLLSTGAKKPNY